VGGSAQKRLSGSTARWVRTAFEPKMMIALLLYACANGERSSRGIERRCREDVAFRVITANQVPDHSRSISRIHASRVATVVTASSPESAGDLTGNRRRDSQSDPESLAFRAGNRSDNVRDHGEL
jgi:Transposase domain (DUF772)